MTNEARGGRGGGVGGWQSRGGLRAAAAAGWVGWGRAREGGPRPGGPRPVLPGPNRGAHGAASASTRDTQTGRASRAGLGGGAAPLRRPFVARKGVAVDPDPPPVVEAEHALAGHGLTPGRDGEAGAYARRRGSEALCKEEGSDTGKRYGEAIRGSDTGTRYRKLRPKTAQDARAQDALARGRPTRASQCTNAETLH